MYLLCNLILSNKNILTLRFKQTFLNGKAFQGGGLGEIENLQSCLNDNLNQMKGVNLSADCIQTYPGSHTWIQRILYRHFIHILCKISYYSYPIFVCLCLRSS